MKKLLTSLMIPVLIALTVAALPIKMGYGQAAPTETEQNAVNKLLELFDRANTTLTEIFAKLEARGITIPEEVLNNYDKGLATAKEAIQLRDEGKYAEAKEKILEAMQHLRNAMLPIGDDLEEAETPEEKEAREAIGIEAATERIQARIEKLREIAENATAQGINASQIIERLGNVTELLIRIREHIEAGNISEAAKEREMSQRWIGEAMAALKPIIETHKVRQAERFLNKTEERLSRISTMINNIISRLPIPEFARKRITQNMGQGIKTAQNKIAEARNLLQEGKITNAISKLGELRADIANLMAEMKQQPNVEPEVGEALEKIDLREIALDILEDRLEILEEKGVNVTDILTKIHEARDLIQSAVENLKKGELTIVENLLTQIDDIIEEAKNLADQLEIRLKSP